MHRAAYHGLIEIGGLLVLHDADPKAKDNDGRTPKDIATLGQEAEMAMWLDAVADGARPHDYQPKQAEPKTEL